MDGCMRLRGPAKARRKKGLALSAIGSPGSACAKRRMYIYIYIYISLSSWLGAQVDVAVGQK